MASELGRGTDLAPDASDDERDEGADLLFQTPFRRPGVASLRNILATLAVGIIIAGLVWAFDRPGVATSQSITLTATASGPAPHVDEAAPDFQLRTLDGQVVHLSDFRGRPVWINFWATWCPPCRAESPDIQAVYEQYKDQGLVILAVSIGEDSDTVAGYAKRTGLTFTIGADESTEVAAAYRIVGIPTHFFVDRDGILRDWRIGSMSQNIMKEKLDHIMAAPAGASGP